MKDKTLEMMLLRIALLCPEYRISFYNLTVDIAIPVVLAVAVGADNAYPRFGCSASARTTYSAACLSALKELQGWLAYSGSSPESADSHYDEPLTVDAGPEEHKESFYSNQRQSEIERLLGPEEALSTSIAAAESLASATSYSGIITKVATLIAQAECSLLIANISHESFSQNGLHCARAIGAGMFPMWYGNGNYRVTRSARLDRLEEAFIKAGVCNGGEPLNLEPHPFG